MTKPQAANTTRFILDLWGKGLAQGSVWKTCAHRGEREDRENKQHGDPSDHPAHGDMRTSLRLHRRKIPQQQIHERTAQAACKHPQLFVTTPLLGKPLRRQAAKRPDDNHSEGDEKFHSAKLARRMIAATLSGPI